MDVGEGVAVFTGAVAVGRLVLVGVSEAGAIVGVEVGCSVNVGLGNAVKVDTDGATGDIDGGVTVPVQAPRINAPVIPTRLRAYERS